MKLTNEIRDTDHIELPVYVNGSFAERIIMTGKELKRLVELVKEPKNSVVEVTSTRIQNDGTGGKNATGTIANVPLTPTAGDAVKEVRKDSEIKAGDSAVEKRGE